MTFNIINIMNECEVSVTFNIINIMNVRYP